MPPENKQPSSPIHYTTRVTTTAKVTTTTPPLIRSFTSPPTLFSVLASEPLRQHIAILCKDSSSSSSSSQPTIMRINTTATPNSDDEEFQTPEDTFEPVAVKKETGDQEEEEEEEEEEEHDTLDAKIEVGVGGLASIKQEQELNETMVEEEESSSSTIEGRIIKQEQPPVLMSSGDDNVPLAHTEARLQPHIFSQSTVDEEESDTSFLSQDHSMFISSSQRSELGEQLSADVFGNGLSLDAMTPKKKLLARTQSDLELPLAQPLPLTAAAVAPATTTTTTSTQARKYKWKTVTITKEVLVIDLDDSDDEGGGEGGEQEVKAETQEVKAETQEVKAEIQQVEKDDVLTQIPSVTEPSVTVLGKRVSVFSDWEDDEIGSCNFDDIATDRRESKRKAISGSENYPLELLDSDTEGEWAEATYPSSGSSLGVSSELGSGSGSGSGVSRHDPQNIVEEQASESNAKPETQTLSQQLREYQQQHKERFMQGHGGTPRQETPVADQQPIPARNSQTPQPFTGSPPSQPFTGSPPPHYQYISDGEDMEEELPPAYAVRGPQPLQLSYPDHMTNDGFELTGTQQHVLDLVVNQRRNVFFTGSAGTGKSVLLRELILRLRAKHSRWRQNNDDWDSQAAGHVAVTASTGIAACNIRGCTLHSFAGIGLGTDSADTLYWKIVKNKNMVNRWKSTQVLLIDEVSMISAELLDLVEELARKLRNDRRPWGGMQVVLVGDFFQLPPVEKVREPRFCFESAAWGSIEECIQLEKVFRQLDHTFVDALNQLRVGIMSRTTLSMFRSLGRPVSEEDGIKPTELFPLRKQVDEANASMLTKLPGTSQFYHAQDGGVLAAKMETNCIAPTVLELKLNAQVMLLKNQSGGSQGLVNGSIGVVIAMTTEAATNVRTGHDGNALPSLNTPGEILPKVRFLHHDTGGYTDMVLGREEWTVEAPALVRNQENQQAEFRTEILGSRIQIPLCLAWAMSIHKSQGQTLPKVKVDLGRVFEKGQAYVALSRATTLDGLQVAHFDERKVMVHQKVIDFYEQIGGVP